jgi:hypothetical protein
VKKLLLVAVLMVPGRLWADSIGFGTAVIDWGHAGWATNGSIVITDIRHAQPSMHGVDADMHITAAGSAVAVAGGDAVYMHAGAYVLDSMWLYGYGTGGVFITIPYTMSAGCEGGGTAVSRVSLSFSNGGSNRQQEDIVLDCRQGSESSGVLTVGLNFSNITFGPLVSIYAQTFVDAVANVSEPSSLILTGVGLVMLMIFARKRSTIR